MKCPKCGYLGFEAVDRCRNCGYEFSLAPRAATPELDMRDPGAAEGPLPDLALRDGGAVPKRAPAGGRTIDLDRVLGAPSATPDLPLFEEAPPAELEPLVSAPSTPRRPLSVRRPTPDPVRLRRSMRDDAPAPRTLDLPLPAAAQPAAPGEARHEPTYPGAPAGPVPAASRLGAALVDVLLLGSIDALVFYFTLRMCELTLAEWHVVPLAPLVAFIVILNGGYLTGFTTAGGQTIGKMAFGLKVVGPGESPVAAGAAAVRALACLVSTVCLGAGLLPVLVRGGRAVHDRLADTDVVRVA